MGCTATGYRTFLICCNFALLFVGGSVLILGLKMKWALSLLFLTSIPIIAKAIEAVIATGFFISLAGLTGISGACYECMWLLIVHLASLGVIVIMEFSLGVTLMFVKNTIQSTVEKSDCSSFCATTLDAMVLDYALPSAGLMMTIIILERLDVCQSAISQQILQTEDGEKLFSDDFQEAENYRDKFLEQCAQIDAEIQASSPSNNSESRKFKLPKIELKKFSGEAKDYLTFWSQFPENPR
ncbi:uncharacterized protein LOC118203636 [Stegodyphus dumicola]|uniref:uncharacterized protein LOC118203636 n=1 Tax=Stegodyphus dumicola TaxID=202533 RepID=UPI0015B1F216|nr:uncharacterized protein LOC118203636 [Stegodyphus dumicola]